ncbi:hypothetical protein DL96DRAFT_848108 [Flagelloscypha sp. PMI_526]|nr:hypothetical protein DL96DRAFT_848108 [Flagelloscypha sp. PMI_526]
MSSSRRRSMPRLDMLLPHPTLRARQSALSGAVSPRTPRTPPVSFVPPMPMSTSRKSSDSWSSSIDERDNYVQDWYPDQILLLSRTLDALPSHLMTPFHGPVPPGNLLDKIARGIADAKGSNWPHSVAATRMKLAEISRTMASDVIPEEENSADYFADSTNAPTRRPIYRQSSMDFMKVDEAKQSERVDRVSSRLQHAERTVSPYNTRSAAKRSSLSRRSSSPPRPTSIVTGPSTASSSTLASTSGLRPSLLRRSVSSLYSSTCASLPSDRMSIASIDSCIAAALSSTDSLAKKPSATRLKRSESVTSRPGAKRAPSYGVLIDAQTKPNARAASPCSSDEEEKSRSRTKVKKARTNSSVDVTGGKTPKIDNGKTSPKKSLKRMNPIRNPSMFGIPLEDSHKPQLEKEPSSLSPSPLAATPVISTTTPPRTLRRMKRLPISPLNGNARLGRKISFGMLSADTTTSPISETAPLPLPSGVTSQRPGIARLGSAFKLT